jgi:hypothetical protein
LTGVECSTRMGMREDRPQARRALASFSQIWLGLFICAQRSASAGPLERELPHATGSI